MHEVGDGDGGQYTDDCHHDHYFYEGESRFAFALNCHVYFRFRLSGVNKAQADYYNYDDQIVYKLPAANRNDAVAGLIPCPHLRTGFRFEKLLLSWSQKRKIHFVRERDKNG